MKRTNSSRIFGKSVCDDKILKNFMPRRKFAKYLKLKSCCEELDFDTACFVANAAKRWATKNGATHYTHWFLPLNGKTAEKQVSFFDITPHGIVENFNAKALIKGETDASSFPSGGERMTFEARGYTIWDYTSPMFIKSDNNGNKVLCIPTAFCSYSGDALDEKTPLLRSMESLNHQALRVLKHLGYDNVKKVVSDVGAEQEYFLIDKKDYEKRLDLKMTGRTLFGQEPAKPQEVHSHYFCALNDKISTFMNQVDKKLWDMGVAAKLQHNEVAPSQHELVPIFTSANIAGDQNQVIMETISNVAKANDIVALFHEKPFCAINGSGKHINWSLSTDSGLNLLDVEMEDKLLFLIFFSSIVAAVDKYHDLIRASAAYRGNDLRLGSDEAPPTLISIFVGDVLQKTIYEEKLTAKNNICAYLDTRVKTLPKTQKDYCDRNRTSPFAFTGNKFEFRMVGSSQSISWPCTCLNSIVAETLCDFADKLDDVKNDKKIFAEKLVKDALTMHKRIIFNGNAYDDAWKEEAKKRGFVELVDSVSCYEALDQVNVLAMFEKMGVLSPVELKIRKNALLKNYIESVEVEAKTTIEMLTREILPSIMSSIEFFDNVKKIDPSQYVEKSQNELSDAIHEISKLHTVLIDMLKKLKSEPNLSKKAQIGNEKILPIMKNIRSSFDAVESIIPSKFKPFPSYNDILFKLD